MSEVFKMMDYADARDDYIEDRIDILWYFIIATIVFTSIGIISVLTYLGI